MLPVCAVVPRWRYECGSSFALLPLAGFADVLAEGLQQPNPSTGQGASPIPRRFQSLTLLENRARRRTGFARPLKSIYEYYKSR